MLFDYGVRAGDSVVVPITWANITSILPNGQTCPGMVHAVNGPVSTIETKHGDFKIATVSVIAMCEYRSRG